MDSRFNDASFFADGCLTGFKNPRSFMQLGRNRSDCCFMDTTLQLRSPAVSNSISFTSKGIKRKWSEFDKPSGQSSPCLGAGHSSSSCSSATACSAASSAKETDVDSAIDLDLNFSLHLGNEELPGSKKHVFSTEPVSKVDLELSLCTGTDESVLTTAHLRSTSVENGVEQETISHGVPYGRKTKTSLHPLFASPLLDVDFLHDLSLTNAMALKCPQQLHLKPCQFEGCGKGARGSSGLCIAHGGGHRCQRNGCHKGADGQTAYCKAHGGGRRCDFLGCTKGAEGRTGYCIAHGGGHRCGHQRCTRAARGKSGLCIRHGGGKRCLRENCTKSAEGLSGLCITHGGGRRCQFVGCMKGAQGSTMFCKAHGGGKRCIFTGCSKGAEGSTAFCKGHGGGKRCSFQGGGTCSKSVHGGTRFCVAHGGGKRCATPDCTRSARGRTDHCVRHGGGKRCKVEGCSRGSQGGTDYCKAHGGGRRCCWGHSGFEHGDAPLCGSLARGKTGLCASHCGLVQDMRVHGGATVGRAVAHCSKPGGCDGMDVDVLLGTGDGSSSSSTHLPRLSTHLPRLSAESMGPLSGPSLVREGRVHGGNLMAMLSGRCSSGG